MVIAPENGKDRVLHSEWYRNLSKYERPDLRKAILQLLDTLLPYALLWALMIWMVQHHVAVWYTAPVMLLAAGLLVRIFIFFHDCGHGSFFPSRTANRVLGYICGILTFTPYEEWRLEHAGHHAGAADLDRRGGGDIRTMTVEEYFNAPKFKRFVYRFYRNPLVLLILGPFFLFLVEQRYAHRGAKSRERVSVLITNLALLAILGLASVTIGVKTYLLIQLPVMTLAGAMGVWLFYIQHQFEEVYWDHHTAWDPVRAALEGSSYYKLPKVLQWFSGNIGLHHIHHLRPRIPNYHLQKVLDEVPELQTAPTITLWKSFSCLFLNLWDEKDRKLVSFRAAKLRRAA